MSPDQEYKWDSGTTVTWTNWYHPDPENNRVDCVIDGAFDWPFTTYNWFDQTCKHETAFVLCEA